jgi:hypothetical protein
MTRTKVMKKRLMSIVPQRCKMPLMNSTKLYFPAGQQNAIHLTKLC